MNLRELTWPVRVYWDLPPISVDSFLIHKVCDELVQIKVLFLSLYDPSSPVTQACRDILARLKGQQVGISLTVSGLASMPDLADALAESKVRTLLIEAGSSNEIASLIENGKLHAIDSMSKGISFPVLRGNYREIPEVVSLCLQHGIRDLVFPIQRLTSDEDIFCLKEEMREELAAGLRKLDYRSLRITIHDPFLWQVFFPEADYHEGGCQAANSMLYIAPEFKVFPCPAFPLEMGNLQETSLREIILSDRKKELRKSLQEPAGNCSDCDLAKKCLGGCRGRALAETGSFDKKDPACS